MSIALSELGAIAECLAAIGAGEVLAELIKRKLRVPSEGELAKHFVVWRRAPPSLEPPYEFVMGSPSKERGRLDDEKQVRVVLCAPFRVMPTAVTYGMWRLMAAKDDHVKRWGGEDRLPVTHVTWFEASLYARWLDHWLREQLSELIPDDYRVALPTEAQREYFTRAGSTMRFWSGDGYEDLARVGWFDENSENLPHPVGEKPANGWGLFDVHGNAWEWCRDWFHEELRGGTDALGPDRGRYRVLRGGSFRSSAWRCRSAFRSGDSPDFARGGVGFRLVLSAPEPSIEARALRV